MAPLPVSGVTIVSADDDAGRTTGAAEKMLPLQYGTRIVIPPSDPDVRNCADECRNGDAVTPINVNTVFRQAEFYVGPVIVNMMETIVLVVS